MLQQQQQQQQQEYRHCDKKVAHPPRQLKSQGRVDTSE